MDRRIAAFLGLAIATLCHGLVIDTLAQVAGGALFQGNQIGSNAFVSSPKGEVYLILNDQLYRKATDDEDSWSQLTSNIKAVAVDPGNEHVLYGVDTRDHVVKSLDDGKTWITLNTGFPNLSLLTIYVNPANPQEVFVGSASGLYKTNDAGFTWRPTSFALAVNQIFVNRRSPSNQYLLSAGIIFTSTDDGNTWKRSESGLPVRLVRGTARTASKSPAFISLLVFVDWQSPFLLATTLQNEIVRSDDGGVSWKTVGTGEPSESSITAAVGRHRIVLCSLNHLYNSDDGTTWKKMEIRSGRNTPVSFMGVVEHPKREGLFLHFRFPADGEITNVGTQKRVGYLDANNVLVGINYGPIGGPMLVKKITLCSMLTLLFVGTLILSSCSAGGNGGQTVTVPPPPPITVTVTMTPSTATAPADGATNRHLHGNGDGHWHHFGADVPMVGDQWNHNL